ncbi:hypothetical protein, partial [Bradyrhizobium sp.]|uniref:hypothetical protein n=1 Tax=Bradyrhizobium sp. TaxID=376 RepID=UPI0029007009
MSADAAALRDHRHRGAGGGIQPWWQILLDHEDVEGVDIVEIADGVRPQQSKATVARHVTDAALLLPTLFAHLSEARGETDRAADPARDAGLDA